MHNSTARTAKAVSAKPVIAPVTDGPFLNVHTRVSRVETIQVPVGPGGEQSVGQFIDSYFQSIADDDGVVEGFELEVSRETFRSIYARRSDSAMAE